MCEAPVIFLCCWCSKVVRFMLRVKNPIFSNNIKNNTIKNITKLCEKISLFSPLCRAPVIFLYCWCSKVVRFMLWVKNDIQLCHWKVTSSVWTIFLLRSSAWCRQLLLSHITQYPTTPQHSTIWKVMWLVEKLTPDRSYRYSIMDPYWYTANIFNVNFTVFKCVRLSTVISVYGLHSIAAFKYSGIIVMLIYSFLL